MGCSDALSSAAAICKQVEAGALPSGVYVYRMTARLASGTLAAQNGQMTLLR